MSEISGGRVSNRNRLVCRLRGHDDAVIVVHASAGAAVLQCDRCQRRKLAPYRATTPPTMAESAARMDVAMVDQGALDNLLWSAEVGAHLAGLLDRGDLS